MASESIPLELVIQWAKGTQFAVRPAHRQLLVVIEALSRLQTRRIVPPRSADLANGVYHLVVRLREHPVMLTATDRYLFQLSLLIPFRIAFRSLASPPIDLYQGKPLHNR